MTLYTDHTAVAGQAYTLPCNITVNENAKWYFSGNDSVNSIDLLVYDNGLTDEFRSRFSFNASVHGLHIAVVQPNDTGNYTCRDGKGDEHVHHLAVHGKWLSTALL